VHRDAPVEVGSHLDTARDVEGRFSRVEVRGFATVEESDHESRTLSRTRSRKQVPLSGALTGDGRSILIQHVGIVEVRGDVRTEQTLVGIVGEDHRIRRSGRFHLLLRPEVVRRRFQGRAGQQDPGAEGNRLAVDHLVTELLTCRVERRDRQSRRTAGHQVTVVGVEEGTRIRQQEDEHRFFDPLTTEQTERTSLLDHESQVVVSLSLPIDRDHRTVGGRLDRFLRIDHRDVLEFAVGRDLLERTLEVESVQGLRFEVVHRTPTADVRPDGFNGFESSHRRLVHHVLEDVDDVERRRSRGLDVRVGPEGFGHQIRTVACDRMATRGLDLEGEQFVDAAAQTIVSLVGFFERLVVEHRFDAVLLTADSIDR